MRLACRSRTHYQAQGTAVGFEASASRSIEKATGEELARKQAARFWK
jgi:hypothetical protein